MRLTPRELQVVSLVAVGRANKDIASELGVKYATVKMHLSNIFDKIGCSNRTELAFMFSDKLDAIATKLATIAILKHAIDHVMDGDV